MLVTLLRIAFFLFLFGGLCLCLTDGAKLRPEFAPAVACSGISSLMVAAGLLNIMPLMLKLITALGLAGAVWFGFKRIRRGFTARELIVVGLWLAAAMAFLLLVRGRRFTNYDNFSHWATVVRAISRNDRLPNFQDNTILFQAYPVGTAVFLYFVQHFLGSTESLILWGQILLDISFLLPLAAFAVKGNRILWAGIAAYALFALTYNTSCYDLPVDTVMPLAGVALLCVVYAGKEAGEPEKKTAWTALPLALFLVSVKNSGVFFVLTGACAYLAMNWGRLQGDPRLVVPYALCGLGMPLTWIYLWERHVAFAFAEGTSSKHALTVENYTSVFGEKSSEDIRQIVSLMAQKVFSLSESLNLALLLLIVLLAILFISRKCRHESTGEALGLIVGAVGIYGIYLGFLLAMYLFSMPTEEALMLGSYGRYVRTVLVYLWGWGVIAALRLSAPGKALSQAALVICCATALCFSYSGARSLFTPQAYEQSVRYSFQSLLEGHDLSYTERYVLYSNDKNAGYLYHLSCYELWTNEVQMCSAETFEELCDTFEDYDWVIVWSQDELIQQYMDERGITDRVFRPEKESPSQ